MSYSHLCISMTLLCILHGTSANEPLQAFGRKVQNLHHPFGHSFASLNGNKRFIWAGTWGKVCPAVLPMIGAFTLSWSSWHCNWCEDHKRAPEKGNYNNANQILHNLSIHKSPQNHGTKPSQLKLCLIKTRGKARKSGMFYVSEKNVVRPIPSVRAILAAFTEHEAVRSCGCVSMVCSFQHRIS